MSLFAQRLLDGTHETGTEGQPGTGSLHPKHDPCGEKLSEQESSSSSGRSVELPGVAGVVREQVPRSSPSHTARQTLPHCKLTVLFKIMRVV